MQSNYPQRPRGIAFWLVLLGALLLLVILLFGILRACGVLGGSEDQGTGLQGGDTAQKEQASSGGNTTAGDSKAASEKGSTRAQGTTATAQLQDAQGNPVGTAEFVEGPNGVTTTVNLLQGQQAVKPGEHGIHIHEKGDITPDFEAAGEHFNPTNAEHGFNNSQGPHAGDLKNITVNEDGSASYQTTNNLLALSSGRNSLLDSDGSALVIHARADDYQTDPAGDSGDRVAAGIIRAAATGEATSAGERTALQPTGGGPVGGPAVVLPAATALLLGSGILIYAALRRKYS